MTQISQLARMLKKFNMIDRPKQGNPKTDSEKDIRVLGCTRGY